MRRLRCQCSPSQINHTGHPSRNLTIPVYEFMLTAEPLNVIGGVGSPPNALAIK
jgi:hypothetical protein